MELIFDELGATLLGLLAGGGVLLMFGTLLNYISGI